MVDQKPSALNCRVALFLYPYGDIRERFAFFVKDFPSHLLWRFFGSNDGQFSCFACFNQDVFAKLVFEVPAESDKPILAGAKFLKSEVAVFVSVSQWEIRRTDGRSRSSASTHANCLVLINLQVLSSPLNPPHVNEVIVAFNRHHTHACGRCFPTVFEHAPFN